MRLVIAVLALSAAAHADAVVPGDAVAIPIPVEGPFQRLPAEPCDRELPPSLPVWGEFALSEILCRELPGGVELQHLLALDTRGVWYLVPLATSGRVRHEGLWMEVHFTLLGMRHIGRNRIEVRYREDLFGVHDHLLQCTVDSRGRPSCAARMINPAKSR